MRRWASALLSCLVAPIASASVVVHVVIDDMDRNTLGIYAEPGAATTPTLDTLAAAGVRFDGFVVNPVCSPTRAALYSGIDPAHSGIGSFILAGGAGPELDPSAPNVANILAEQGVGVVMVGKLHVGHLRVGQGGEFNSFPAAMGWTRAPAYFVSNINNDIPAGTLTGGGTHINWARCNLAGTCFAESELSADVILARAIAEIRRAKAAGGDHLIWVNHPFAHAPFASASAGPAWGSCPTTDEACYLEMVERLDTDVAAIQAELTLTAGNDTLIVSSENGRPESTVGVGACNLARAKFSGYACGTVGVLIVAGNGVTTPGIARAPVQDEDIFTLILGLFGVDRTTHDSRSIASCLSAPTTCAPRTVAIANYFEANRTQGNPPQIGDTVVAYQPSALTIVNSTQYFLVRTYDVAPITGFTDEIFDIDADFPNDTPLSLVAGDSGAAAVIAQAALDALAANASALSPQGATGVTMTGVTFR